MMKFLQAKEIAEILAISRASAYRIVKMLNDELSCKGYLTFAGRVPEQYFCERMYCKT